MKKLLLILILFCGCSESLTNAPNYIQGHSSFAYKGTISQYLVSNDNKDSVLLQTTPITITLEEQYGTFTVRSPHLIFVDSIRMIDNVNGILFPSDISYDSANAWCKTLQRIVITQRGDSLNGTLPLDWDGFYYTFTTAKQWTL